MIFKCYLSLVIHQGLKYNLLISPFLFLLYQSPCIQHLNVLHNNFSCIHYKEKLCLIIYLLIFFNLFKNLLKVFFRLKIIKQLLIIERDRKKPRRKKISIINLLPPKTAIWRLIVSHYWNKLFTINFYSGMKN